jgi:WD40 repeat protein/tetratricopeptide (TPR) repeat protein
VAVLHGHTGAVVDVAFAPGGRRLASLSSKAAIWAGDDTVRVWDVDPGATLPVLRGHTSYVYPVAFSPDGRWIASGGWDHTVRLWDALTGDSCAVLRLGNNVRTLAFGPAGNLLVTGCDQDRRLRIWDVATGAPRQVIQTPGAIPRAVAVSPDGARIAALDMGQDGAVWDVATGAEVVRLRIGTGHDSKALAYSPDGRWLAGTSTDQKTVCLWEAQTHQLVAQFSGHEDVIRSVVFSPDSRLLASTSSDRTVRVWDVTTGRCQVLPGHTDEVFAAAFHPGGTRLASAGRDQAILLWDLARGVEVARLPGHTRYVWSLAWSPDGTTLASGSGDFTVRLWDTAPLKTRYQARREAAALRPEAERLVKQLWRQKNDAAEVVEALRADGALSEALRQAALRAVLRAADRRALATHLEQAKASLRDAKRQAIFRFHLRWLGEAELTSAADLAARGALYARDGQWDRATADFTRATQLAPDDEAVWYDCGAGWAAVGRWEQALPYFARFADLGRGTDLQWRSITPLPLYLGDRETYRRRYRKMIELFGRSADPSLVSQLLIWGPLAGDSGVDPGLLLQQIDRCLAGDEKRPRDHWMVEAKGMAEYRAGRMERAVEWLRKAESHLHGAAGPDEANKVVTFFFLSMAYQRLNRAEEAKAKYQQGLRQMEKTFGGLDQYQPGKGWDWYDWPMCQVVRREAEALLKGN